MNVYINNIYSPIALWLHEVVIKLCIYIHVLSNLEKPTFYMEIITLIKTSLTKCTDQITVHRSKSVDI